MSLLQTNYLLQDSRHNWRWKGAGSRLGMLPPEKNCVYFSIRRKKLIIWAYASSATISFARVPFTSMNP